MHAGLRAALLAARPVATKAWLQALMVSQAGGCWYDFGQTDRLFQDANGTVAVTTPNDVIGLTLDQQTWLGKTPVQAAAGQVERVTNGGPDFVNTTALGVTTATLAISGGDLVATATSGSGARVEFPVTGLSVGRAYCAIVRVKRGVGVKQFLDQWTWASVLKTAVTTDAEFAEHRFVLVATATSGVLRVYVNGTSADAGNVGDSVIIDSVSVREVPGNHAVQATSSFRPRFQATGAVYDGNDDRLDTGYLLPEAAAGFVVAAVTVPAVLPAVQAICGASAGGGALWLSLATTGQLRTVVGTTQTVVGPDLRGQTVTVGVSWDGAGNARTMLGGTIYPHTYLNIATATQPIRVGALGTSGGAASFFGGSIRSLVIGRQFLDPDTLTKLADAL